ncbi:hemerythrin domain-containing protein [Fodinicurvata halophila]|uniref:Hemerythrin domain-containing protein n=1 Tax=Fodinicurvata halophila TaxID=1419723 RepID=A0ABV8UMV3_9PROT
MMGAGRESGSGNHPAAPGALLLAPVDTRLFERPLDHLVAENTRLLRVCAQLELIALNAGRLAPYSTPVLLAYLRWDYPRHLDWLDHRFLPQLEHACFVGDSIQGPVAQLVLEHGVDRGRAARLAGILSDYSESPHDGLEQRLAISGDAFAEAQKRHVAWMDLVILPLAQSRLSERNLQDLSQGLHVHYG